MSPNVDLLRRTLAHIEAHPETWRQHHYAVQTDCGTAYCFAGWAVQIAHPEAVAVFIGSDVVGYLVTLGDDLRDIDSLATDLLQLTDSEAETLFFSGNSLEDLRELVAELTADAPEVAR